MTKKEQKTIETNIRENMAKEKSIKAMLEKTTQWIDILAELKKAETDSIKLLHQQLTERKFEMQKQLYSMRQYELDFKKS